METGEIRTLKVLKQAFDQSTEPKKFIDARNLLTRAQIDAAKTPVLFVELASGQNGTLTPYPGQGIGQTWLGADGATVTTEQGILKASRGMGDDLMGSSSTIPQWSKINHNTKAYSRELHHLNGNNKLYTSVFKCEILKSKTKEIIEIWKVKFRVRKFEETCDSIDFQIRNIYYLDEREIVRKSLQYHSNKIGYIVTERVDR